MDRRMMEKSRCMMVKEMSRPGVACMCVQVFSLPCKKNSPTTQTHKQKTRACTTQRATRMLQKNGAKRRMTQKGEWRKKENGTKDKNKNDKKK